MSKDSEFWPGKDERYAQLGITDDMIPLSESLKDVTKRTSVFWDEVIEPELHAGKKVMIVGHENNLRSLIKRLDSISEEDILHIELPRAIPLVYKLDKTTLKPLPIENSAPGLNGKYLERPDIVEQIYKRDLKIVYGEEDSEEMIKNLEKLNP